MVSWVRAILEQCKAADVACFVKQLGSRPIVDDKDGVQMIALGAGWDRLDPPNQHLGYVNLRDRKGGDPTEWPIDLRVREMPT
jgi:hypothetical protein